MSFEEYQEAWDRSFAALDACIEADPARQEALRQRRAAAAAWEDSIVLATRRLKIAQQEIDAWLIRSEVRSP